MECPVSCLQLSAISNLLYVSIFAISICAISIYSCYMYLYLLYLYLSTSAISICATSICAISISAISISAIYIYICYIYICYIYLYLLYLYLPDTSNYIKWVPSCTLLSGKINACQQINKIMSIEDTVFNYCWFKAALMYESVDFADLRDQWVMLLLLI